MSTDPAPRDGTVPEAATPSSSAVLNQGTDPAADPGTSAARVEHRSEGIGQTEGHGEGEVAEERAASTPPKRRETVSQRMRVSHPARFPQL